MAGLAEASRQTTQEADVQIVQTSPARQGELPMLETPAGQWAPGRTSGVAPAEISDRRLQQPLATSAPATVCEAPDLITLEAPPRQAGNGSESHGPAASSISSPSAVPKAQCTMAEATQHGILARPSSASALHGVSAASAMLMEGADPKQPKLGQPDDEALQLDVGTPPKPALASAKSSRHALAAQTNNAPSSPQTLNRQVTESILAPPAIPSKQDQDQPLLQQLMMGQSLQRGLQSAGDGLSTLAPETASLPPNKLSKDAHSQGPDAPSPGKSYQRSDDQSMLSGTPVTGCQNIIGNSMQPELSSASAMPSPIQAAPRDKPAQAVGEVSICDAVVHHSTNVTALQQLQTTDPQSAASSIDPAGIRPPRRSSIIEPGALSTSDQDLQPYQELPCLCHLAEPVLDAVRTGARATCTGVAIDAEDKSSAGRAFEAELVLEKQSFKSQPTDPSATCKASSNIKGNLLEPADVLPSVLPGRTHNLLGSQAMSCVWVPIAYIA